MPHIWPDLRAAYGLNFHTYRSPTPHTVYSPSSDFVECVKSIVGGELVGYSKLLQRARDDAYARMIEDAKSKGANAIIAFRFQTSTIAKGASEVVAYGTAVRI